MFHFHEVLKFLLNVFPLPIKSIHLVLFHGKETINPKPLVILAKLVACKGVFDKFNPISKKDALLLN
jgi:hypothetical protein